MSGDASDFIAKYWHEYEEAKVAGPPADEDEDLVWPAWWELDQYVKTDVASKTAFGIDRIGLLVAVAQAAPESDGLEYLGVGAIENYLRSHEPDIDRIEAAARECESFRLALKFAWFESFLAPEVVERLRTLAPKP